MRVEHQKRVKDDKTYPRKIRHEIDPFICVTEAYKMDKTGKRRKIHNDF